MFKFSLDKQGRPQDRIAGGKEEYNAFFYSLVSTDTQVCIYLLNLFNLSILVYIWNFNFAIYTSFFRKLDIQLVIHLNAGDVLFN